MYIIRAPVIFFYFFFAFSKKKKHASKVNCLCMLFYLYFFFFIFLCKQSTRIIVSYILREEKTCYSCRVLEVEVFFSSFFSYTRNRVLTLKRYILVGTLDNSDIQDALLSTDTPLRRAFGNTFFTRMRNGIKYTKIHKIQLR